MLVHADSSFVSIDESVIDNFNYRAKYPTLSNNKPHPPAIDHQVNQLVFADRLAMFAEH